MSQIAGNQRSLYSLGVGGLVGDFVLERVYSGGAGPGDQDRSGGTP